MSRFSFCLLGCIGLVAFMGCGDDNTGDADSAPTKHDAQVSVVDISTDGAIEGATVCVLGLTDPCLVTDAQGVASFEYEAGVDMTMTVEADGYWTARLGGRLAASEDDAPATMTVQMGGNAVVDLLAGQAPGVEGGASTEHGHVVLAAGDGGDENVFVSGVSFTMTPASGVGPLYFAPGDALTNAVGGGVYDADATATSDNGFANYYNVAPGAYTLNATHDTHTCRPFYGLPGEASSFTIDVVAGQLTYAVVVCQ